MAAWVEASTREMGQSLINPDKPSVSASALPGDTGKTALGPKSHLMPKPFVLQRNATIRPIRAPKTNFSRELNRATSSEMLFDITKPDTGGSKPSESLKSGSNDTVNGSNQSAAPKLIPLSPKPDLMAKAKPEPTKTLISSTNQTGLNSKPGVTFEDVKDVQLRSRAKSLGSQEQKILSQKVQGEAAKTDADVKMSSKCWPPRNRLSVELTSKFESLSPPEKSWPPHSPSESSSSKPLMEKGETGEEVIGGSIKRRISLLFDRSTAARCRDTFNKRDNPQAEISVDIKQRIQNLSLDAPRTRLPSTGAHKSPPSEKTQSTSDEPPNERSSEKPAVTEKVTGDKAASTTEIKNSAASVENVEEEEDHVAIPVYQRVGMSLDEEKKRREEEEKQRKDEQLEQERQQRERERLLEEERKQERKQEEEKQRQMEERRKQEEERLRRIEEERKEEERRRQAEKERERQIEEEKRRIQEEKERLREEERLEKLKKEKEMEERKQMEEERLKEKERLRQEHEKERLQKEKEMEEERRRIQEMERQKEEERLRQEREKERLRKEKEMEEERRRIQEMERQKEEERLRQEREKERLRKEKEMEEEKQRIQEMERQKEDERMRQEQEKERLQKEKEMEEERRRIQEMERQKEEEDRLRQEREKERLQKEKEMEEERRRIQEMERQKEEERLRQEGEKERLRKEKEMEEERRRIQEMERQKEEERLRKDQELERIRKEKEMEEEKQRIQMERLKEEERLRQEREKERLQKEKEMEEERRRIQEMERQKEEERLRQEREIERLQKEREIEERKRIEEERQREEERLRQERERERLKKEKAMEEERRRIQEMERLKEEERLRQEREKERLWKEKEMEEERRRIQEMERLKEEERLRQEREIERLQKEREIEERKRMEEERQREEERLRQERERERLKKEKAMEEERQRIKELERQKEEERLRKERDYEMEMETCKAAERSREEVPTSYDLISFDAEEPAASQTLVSTVQAADVPPLLTEVIYDDFSVKPRRWGTRARRSSTPSPSREPPAAPDHSLQPESKSNDPGSQEPCGDQVYVHDLMGFEPEASSPQDSTESRKQTYLFEESKPEDLLEPQTQSDEGELKDSESEEDAAAEQDTENLIGETDEQNENNDTVDNHATQTKINQVLQRLTQVRQRNTSTDSDTADVPIQEEPEPLPVLETAAPLPDSSVFRSKVDLGKKRSIKRSRPSRSIRQRAALPSLTEGTHPDWRFCDSTEAKDQCSNGADSESEEEPSQDVTSSPAPSQPKRVPVFPGMDPSALMAQLKRRSGVAETVSPAEAQTPPSVPTRSPRTHTRSLGPRVLPPVDAKDSGSGSSPSWLLELKSKKRMSQPESEA